MPASRTSAARAGELSRVAGVDELPIPIGAVEESGKLLGAGTQLGPGSSCKMSALDRHVPGFDRPVLAHPGVPSAVEHADGVMSVVGERPPQSGRVLTAHVIDRDHAGLIAD